MKLAERSIGFVDAEIARVLIEKEHRQSGSRAIHWSYPRPDINKIRFNFVWTDVWIKRSSTN